MARNRNDASSEPEPTGLEFPDDGVVLYDRSGREYTARTRLEYTQLRYADGYSEDKPKDPEPEPEVPPPPPGA